MINKALISAETHSPDCNGILFLFDENVFM